jgi:acyl carrier protein phosphodiesterase
MKGYQDLVMDIAADHVIASHWDMLFDTDLSYFSSHVAEVFESRQRYLTEKGIIAAEGMMYGDWFGAYAQRDGFVAALERMAERAKRGHLIQDNISLVLDMLPEIGEQVLQALPSIREHSREHMGELGYDPTLRLRWRDEISADEYIRRRGER